MLVRHHLEMHRVRLEATLSSGDPTIVAERGRSTGGAGADERDRGDARAKGSRAAPRVRVEGDDERVVLSIEDTGVGIQPELVPHIFEPFVTTKGETSGVGLGLAVVYGVVHGHGGEITVRSTPVERHLRFGCRAAPSRWASI